jgi:hypothetical protein
MVARAMIRCVTPLGNDVSYDHDFHTFYFLGSNNQYWDHEDGVAWAILWLSLSDEVRDWLPD